MKESRSRKVPVVVYLAVADVERIDRLVAAYEARFPGAVSSRSEVARGAVEGALGQMERLLGLCLNQPTREKRRRTLRGRLLPRHLRLVHSS
jgi:hypothetical protein